MVKPIDDFFVADSVPPERMDQFWEDGWRHFGCCFFRFSLLTLDGHLRRVQPLRVDLALFNHSKSQRRVLRKNADLALQIKPSVIDEERRLLFAAHRCRFKHDVPSGLEVFLGASPATQPCQNVEVGLYLAGRLVAASYLDIGQQAVSSVYAIFDPAHCKRSLGIATMLFEIAHARERGCRYYYPGYATHEPFGYDYKKRFRGAEWFDWKGCWHPLEC